MLYCTSLATLPWILFAFISLFIFISQTAGPRQRQTRTVNDTESEERIGEGARDTCSYQIRVGCESDLKKVPQPANWINSVATCACQMWHFLPPNTRCAPTKNTIFIGGQTPKHCDMTNAPLNPSPSHTHTPHLTPWPKQTEQLEQKPFAKLNKM